MTRWYVRLSRDAETDFAEILIYTHDTFGDSQVRTYQGVLTDTLTTLSEGPTVLGSVVLDDILPNLRSLHVARRGRRGRHFILYRAADGQTIEVLRILHDAMDIARHIQPEP